MRPLEGFRVLDLSTVVMGPWATYLLARYGADVVKIEPPEGDVQRHAGAARHPLMGSLFLMMNRGKRSAVLDLKDPAAREALLRLCAGADVLVHNVRPAAAKRLGIGYDAVAAANPRIIYAQLVGYAQDGPYAARPAYDDLIQGITGIASLFEAVGDAPRYVPALIADRITGMNAVHAILAALLRRERGGGGTALEIPMYETLADMVLADHLGGAHFDPPDGPIGYSRILTPNRRPFRTTDGFVGILLHAEKHWERFFALVGQSERFAATPWLHDMLERRRNYDAAYGAVAEIVATRATAFWLEALGAQDIPVVPIHAVAELVEDPQLAATLWRREDHPTEGALRTVRTPWRASAWDEPPLRPAPALGEHTGEILAEAQTEDRPAPAG